MHNDVSILVSCGHPGIAAGLIAGFLGRRGAHHRPALVYFAGFTQHLPREQPRHSAPAGRPGRRAGILSMRARDIRAAAVIAAVPFRLGWFSARIANPDQSPVF